VRKKSPIGLISAASWDGTGFLEDKAQVLSHPGVCVCVIAYIHGLHGGLELLDSLPQNRMGSGVLLH